MSFEVERPHNNVVSRPLVIAVVAVVLLCATPWVANGALSVAHDDQVHYGGHLLAGRIFSLCPCTAELAETQLIKAMYHARTPRQAALLTTQRPTSIGEHIAEAP